MNKVKKLFRNSLIIFGVLFFVYYFCGFYVSKEQCDKETMRGLYANETTYVMEFTYKNHTRTIYTNPIEKTMSIIGRKKYGLLYQTGSCSTGYNIKTEEAIDIFGSYSRDIGGMISVVYRNDPSVNKVEVCFENGICVLLDDWKYDFVGTLVAGDDWYSGVYKAYDHQGNLLAEIEY